MYEYNQSVSLEIYKKVFEKFNYVPNFHTYMKLEKIFLTKIRRHIFNKNDFINNCLNK